MVILHIASLADAGYTGVCVVVPQHVIAQSQYETVAIINTRNIPIKVFGENEKQMQLTYKKDFCLRELPKPFNKPDLVVFHECYRIEYLIIERELIHNKIPYVIIPHGELRKESQHSKFLKKAVANLLLFNQFINHSIAIQCLSEGEMEATSFNKTKIVGTNGVPIPTEYKHDFSKDSVKFVYIGRYDWYIKGFDLLLSAIAEKRDYFEENKVFFEFYGPDVLGQLDSVLKIVQDNKLEELVSVNSPVYGEEKRRKLLESDIFIQTSRHEGMPMGVLEAMSYGIPCLLSKGTTLGEKIEAAGAGWNGGETINDISRALVRAVRERQKWTVFGENARKYILTNHSWPIVSKETIGVYKTLLQSLQ